MVIRATDSELDIAGTPAELNALADRIERVRAPQEVTEPADATADPRPYDRCLARLRVRVTDGPTRVNIVGDEIVVTAAASMMRAFASYFRFDPAAPFGTHSHHEWFDGDKHIAPDSRPLVISVR